MRLNLSKFNQRLVALLMLLVLLSVVVTVGVLLLPDRTLAQGGDSEQGQPNATPANPPTPPPVVSPIQTPEPGEKIISPAEKAGQLDVEAVRFRPKLQRQVGEPSILAQKSAQQTKDMDSLRAAGSQGSEGPQAAYDAPDFKSVLAAESWTEIVYEDFEGIFPGSWQLFDTSNDGFDRQWGDTLYLSQSGLWSGWPAARGLDFVDPANGYPNNMNSWLIQGPFNLSNADDLFVGFGLWYDTEPDWDWVYFCVSVEGLANFVCDYWSGYSGDWEDIAYWLTSYAGYPEVYFAWNFESDSTISGAEGFFGPYVDEITIWTY